MKQKISKWELLFAVGLMLVLVVGLWGASSSGLRLGSQVLAGSVPQVTNGDGNEPGTIVSTGTGRGTVLPPQSWGPGTSGQVAFGPNATTLSGDDSLYWDSTNNRLGIGTTTPSRLLHIKGNICLFERNVNSAGFIIDRTGGASANRWVFGADEPTGFVIKTYPVDGGAAVEQLVITKDDPGTGTNESKVGIGTTSPTLGKLHVETTSSTSIHGENTSSDNYGDLGTSNYGVRGHNTDGIAGYFEGDVTVTQDLTKGGGSFKIDHPLDPENKYLQHSFVESPDMMNVYNGNVVLDEDGEAVVELPSYFETLNRDFRYQLTCIGGYAPVYIAEKVKDNCFKIAGGTSGLEVSWQVTGIRQDPYAKVHPVQVEKEKPANEKGYYLHPKEWGQPEEKGIGSLR